MHTLKILALGFVLLVATLVSASLFGERARVRAAALFISIWCLICTANAAMGIKAGYSLTVEVSVFGLTFGPPATLVLLARHGVA